MSLLPAETLRMFDGLNRQHLELEASVTVLKNVTEFSEQQGLMTQIRAGVNELRKQIENMKLLADEQDRDKERQTILQHLQKNEDQFKQLQVSFRQAILTSKHNIEREAKIQLFAAGDDSRRECEIRRRNLTSEDNVLHTTNDVTKTLQRTVQLMQQEIERSAYSAKVLDESSRTLKTTYNEYRGFSTVLRGAKQVITKLEQSDWTDRLLILFGLMVFILVVLYILKKRVLDTGLGWMTWLTSWII